MMFSCAFQSIKIMNRKVITHKEGIEGFNKTDGVQAKLIHTIFGPGRVIRIRRLCILAFLVSRVLQLLLGRRVRPWFRPATGRKDHVQVGFIVGGIGLEGLWVEDRVCDLNGMANVRIVEEIRSRRIVADRGAVVSRGQMTDQIGFIDDTPKGRGTIEGQV